MSEANFSRYDKEFHSIRDQIERSLRNSSNDSLVHSELFRQCDDLIKQMALEARSSQDSATRRSLLEKVRSCKTTMQSLQQESEKRYLCLGLGVNSSPHSQNERLLLQQNEDTLAQQNDTLERARHTMQETEAVALEITGELSLTREKLSSVQARVRDVSSLSGRARRVLTSMNHRAMQQKLVVYVTAAVLLIGLLIMIYATWG